MKDFIYNQTLLPNASLDHSCSIGRHSLFELLGTLERGTQSRVLAMQVMNLARCFLARCFARPLFSGEKRQDLGRVRGHAANNKQRSRCGDKATRYYHVTCSNTFHPDSFFVLVFLLALSSRPPLTISPFQTARVESARTSVEKSSSGEWKGNTG